MANRRDTEFDYLRDLESLITKLDATYFNTEKGCKRYVDSLTITTDDLEHWEYTNSKLKVFWRLLIMAECEMCYKGAKSVFRSFLRSCKKVIIHGSEDNAITALQYLTILSLHPDDRVQSTNGQPIMREDTLSEDKLGKVEVNVNFSLYLESLREILRDNKNLQLLERKMYIFHGIIGRMKKCSLQTNLRHKAYDAFETFVNSKEVPFKAKIHHLFHFNMEISEPCTNLIVKVFTSLEETDSITGPEGFRCLQHVHAICQHVDDRVITECLDMVKQIKQKDLKWASWGGLASAFLNKRNHSLSNHRKKCFEALRSIGKVYECDSEYIEDKLRIRMDTIICAVFGELTDGNRILSWKSDRCAEENCRYPMSVKPPRSWSGRKELPNSRESHSEPNLIDLVDSPIHAVSTSPHIRLGQTRENGNERYYDVMDDEIIVIFDKNAEARNNGYINPDLENDQLKTNENSMAYQAASEKTSAIKTGSIEKVTLNVNLQSGTSFNAEESADNELVDNDISLPFKGVTDEHMPKINIFVCERAASDIAPQRVNEVMLYDVINNNSTNKSTCLNNESVSDNLKIKENSPHFHEATLESKLENKSGCIAMEDIDTVIVVSNEPSSIHNQSDENSTAHERSLSWEGTAPLNAEKSKNNVWSEDIVSTKPVMNETYLIHDDLEKDKLERRKNYLVNYSATENAFTTKTDYTEKETLDLHLHPKTSFNSEELTNNELVDRNIRSPCEEVTYDLAQKTNIFTCERLAPATITGRENDVIPNDAINTNSPNNVKCLRDEPIEDNLEININRPLLHESTFANELENKSRSTAMEGIDEVILVSNEPSSLYKQSEETSSVHEMCLSLEGTATLNAEKSKNNIWSEDIVSTKPVMNETNLRSDDLEKDKLERSKNCLVNYSATENAFTTKTDYTEKETLDLHLQPETSFNSEELTNNELVDRNIRSPCEEVTYDLAQKTNIFTCEILASATITGRENDVIPNDAINTNSPNNVKCLRDEPIEDNLEININCPLLHESTFANELENKSRSTAMEGIDEVILVSNEPSSLYKQSEETSNVHEMCLSLEGAAALNAEKSKNNVWSEDIVSTKPVMNETNLRSDDLEKDKLERSKNCLVKYSATENAFTTKTDYTEKETLDLHLQPETSLNSEELTNNELVDRNIRSPCEEVTYDLAQKTNIFTCERLAPATITGRENDVIPNDAINTNSLNNVKCLRDEPIVDNLEININRPLLHESTFANELENKSRSTAMEGIDEVILVLNEPSSLYKQSEETSSVHEMCLSLEGTATLNAEKSKNNVWSEDIVSTKPVMNEAYLIPDDLEKDKLERSKNCLVNYSATENAFTTKTDYTEKETLDLHLQPETSFNSEELTNNELVDRNIRSPCEEVTYDLAQKTNIFTCERLASATLTGRENDVIPNDAINTNSPNNVKCLRDEPIEDNLEININRPLLHESTFANELENKSRSTAMEGIDEVILVSNEPSSLYKQSEETSSVHEMCLSLEGTATLNAEKSKYNFWSVYAVNTKLLMNEISFAAGDLAKNILESGKNCLVRHAANENVLSTETSYPKKGTLDVNLQPETFLNTEELASNESVDRDLRSLCQEVRANLKVGANAFDCEITATEMGCDRKNDVMPYDAINTSSQNKATRDESFEYKSNINENCPLLNNSLFQKVNSQSEKCLKAKELASKVWIDRGILSSGQEETDDLKQKTNIFVCEKAASEIASNSKNDVMLNDAINAKYENKATCLRDEDKLEINKNRPLLHLAPLVNELENKSGSTAKENIARVILVSNEASSVGHGVNAKSIRKGIDEIACKLAERQMGRNENCQLYDAATKNAKRARGSILSWNGTTHLNATRRKISLTEEYDISEKPRKKKTRSITDVSAVEKLETENYSLLHKALFEKALENKNESIAKNDNAKDILVSNKTSSLHHQTEYKCRAHKRGLSSDETDIFKAVHSENNFLFKRGLNAKSIRKGIDAIADELARNKMGTNKNCLVFYTSMENSIVYNIVHGIYKFSFEDEVNAKSIRKETRSIADALAVEKLESNGMFFIYFEILLEIEFMNRRLYFAIDALANVIYIFGEETESKRRAHKSNLSSPQVCMPASLNAGHSENDYSLADAINSKAIREGIFSIDDEFTEAALETNEDSSEFQTVANKYYCTPHEVAADNVFDNQNGSCENEQVNFNIVIEKTHGKAYDWAYLNLIMSEWNNEVQLSYDWFPEDNNSITDKVTSKAVKAVKKSIENDKCVESNSVPMDLTLSRNERPSNCRTFERSNNETAVLNETPLKKAVASSSKGIHGNNESPKELCYALEDKVLRERYASANVPSYYLYPQQPVSSLAPAYAQYSTIVSLLNMHDKVQDFYPIQPVKNVTVNHIPNYGNINPCFQYTNPCKASFASQLRKHITRNPRMFQMNPSLITGAQEKRHPLPPFNSIFKKTGGLQKSFLLNDKLSSKETHISKGSYVQCTTQRKKLRLSMEEDDKNTKIGKALHNSNETNFILQENNGTQCIKQRGETSGLYNSIHFQKDLLESQSMRISSNFNTATPHVKFDQINLPDYSRSIQRESTVTHSDQEQWQYGINSTPILHNTINEKSKMKGFSFNGTFQRNKTITLPANPNVQLVQREVTPGEANRWIRHELTSFQDSYRHPFPTYNTLISPVIFGLHKSNCPSNKRILHRDPKEIYKHGESCEKNSLPLLYKNKKTILKGFHHDETYSPYETFEVSKYCDTQHITVKDRLRVSTTEIIDGIKIEQAYLKSLFRPNCYSSNTSVSIVNAESRQSSNNPGDISITSKSFNLASTEKTEWQVYSLPPFDNRNNGMPGLKGFPPCNTYKQQFCDTSSASPTNAKLEQPSNDPFNTISINANTTQLGMCLRTSLSPYHNFNRIPLLKSSLPCDAYKHQFCATSSASPTNAKLEQPSNNPCNTISINATTTELGMCQRTSLPPCHISNGIPLLKSSPPCDTYKHQFCATSSASPTNAKLEQPSNNPCNTISINATTTELGMCQRTSLPPCHKSNEIPLLKSSPPCDTYKHQFCDTSSASPTNAKLEQPSNNPCNTISINATTTELGMCQRTSLPPCHNSNGIPLLKSSPPCDTYKHQFCNTSSASPTNAKLEQPSNNPCNTISINATTMELCMCQRTSLPPCHNSNGIPLLKSSPPCDTYKHQFCDTSSASPTNAKLEQPSNNPCNTISINATTTELGMCQRTSLPPYHISNGIPSLKSSPPCDTYKHQFRASPIIAKLEQPSSNLCNTSVILQPLNLTTTERISLHNSNGIPLLKSSPPCDTYKHQFCATSSASPTNVKLEQPSNNPCNTISINATTTELGMYQFRASPINAKLEQPSSNPCNTSVNLRPLNVTTTGRISLQPYHNSNEMPLLKGSPPKQSTCDNTSTLFSNEKSRQPSNDPYNTIQHNSSVITRNPNIASTEHAVGQVTPLPPYQNSINGVPILKGSPPCNIHEQQFGDVTSVSTINAESGQSSNDPYNTIQYNSSVITRNPNIASTEHAVGQLAPFQPNQNSSNGVQILKGSPPGNIHEQQFGDVTSVSTINAESGQQSIKSLKRSSDGRIVLRNSNSTSKEINKKQFEVNHLTTSNDTIEGKSSLKFLSADKTHGRNESLQKCGDIQCVDIKKKPPLVTIEVNTGVKVKKAFQESATECISSTCNTSVSDAESKSMKSLKHLSNGRSVLKNHNLTSKKLGKRRRPNEMTKENDSLPKNRDRKNEKKRKKQRLDMYGIPVGCNYAFGKKDPDWKPSRSKISADENNAENCFPYKTRKRVAQEIIPSELQPFSKKLHANHSNELSSDGNRPLGSILTNADNIVPTMSGQLPIYTIF